MDANYTKRYYYSLEPSYIFLKEEDTYATARGPGYTDCYERYDGPPGRDFRLDSVSIIVPKTAAQGKPWVLTGDAIERDSTVEQALLAKGYHIVNVRPMERRRWDDTYKLLVDQWILEQAGVERDRAEGRRSLRLGGCKPGQGLLHLCPESATCTV